LGTIGKLWYRGWTTDRSEWMRPTGRLLVLLTTLLVLVMPVTEHLYSWDHFLRGGQDVEFNLLAALLFAAMVVLSMNGAVMQPLLTQPAFVATIDPRGQVTRPCAPSGREPSRQAASNPLRSQAFDDFAPDSGSSTLRPLRI
jgi:hypothetical protein